MAGVDIIGAVSRGRRMAVAAGVFALLVTFVGATLPAHAQQDCDNPSDPYSGGNPNCEEQDRLTIELSLNSGPPGTTFIVDASGFDVGETATITFGGIVVRTATATPSGTALGAGPLAVVGVSLPVQLPFLRGQATGGASISERVTAPDVAPGPYDVCVSAEGAGTACDTFRVTPATSVGGVNFTRGGDANASSGTSVRGLARTGFGVLAFVVFAVMLIVLGRYLVSKTRRTRRA